MNTDKHTVTDSRTVAGEHESVERAHISMLRERCEELQRDNDELKAKVALIPRIILQARLDAKEGRQTKYSV